MGSTVGDRSPEDSTDLQDSLTEQCRRALALEAAQPRHVQSLQHWIEGTGCLARDETAYLYEHDLRQLNTKHDVATSLLEQWVEDTLNWCYKGFRQVSALSLRLLITKTEGYHISENKNVYIYTGRAIMWVARLTLLALVALLLLAPVIICNTAVADSARMVVISLATVLYLVVLMRLTNAKAIELIMAGAT